MPKKSIAVPDPPITFQTTVPPPVLSTTHIGRRSFTVVWPHIYGVSHYRVTISPGPTVDVVAPLDPGTLVTYNFTNLTMDYPYTIAVRAVNKPASAPEAVGPPGELSLRTLTEWAQPPAQGLDGWDGTQYTPGRTNFTYSKSGIFLAQDSWAKAAVVAGALRAPDGVTADRQEGMSWIEFYVDLTPEIAITAVFMKAGHRWPQ